jgi:hypothetical protein
MHPHAEDAPGNPQSPLFSKSFWKSIERIDIVLSELDQVAGVTGDSVVAAGCCKRRG